MGKFHFCSPEEMVLDFFSKVGKRRDMAYIQHSSVIPFSRSEVFKYVTDVNRLPDLLPDDYHLKLTVPPLEMRKGAEYEFKIQRFGVSHLWSIRVDDFIEDEMYVERQILGLFDTWILTCQLEDHGDGKTLISNYLEYEIPGGIIGKFFDDVWLRKDLKRIFEVGHQKLTASLNKKGV
jgi:ligand-binding SRPBCC domain-containing protein